MAYVTNNLVAWDQALNTALSGWPDETLSARCYRNDGTKARWTVARRVIDFVALHVFRQKNHCYEAFISEQMRRQAPVEERDPEWSWKGAKQ